MQPCVSGWPRQLLLSFAVAMGLAVEARAQAPEPAAAPAAAPDPDAPGARLIQSVTVSPVVAFAGSDMRVVVRVKPDADNRRLQMSVDAPTFYASTERQLDGSDGARAHIFNLSELPAGDYEITATLEGTAGVRSTVTKQFKVMGDIEDTQLLDAAPPRGRRGRGRP